MKQAPPIVLAVWFLLFSFPLLAQTRTACLAHHPQYIDGKIEVTYEPGCTGHDEPEIFPVSSAPGSARDLTWHVILPTDGPSFKVSDVGPTFWFGGTVADPKSFLGQSFF